MFSKITMIKEENNINDILSFDIVVRKVGEKEILGRVESITIFDENGNSSLNDKYLTILID